MCIQNAPVAGEERKDGEQTSQGTKKGFFSLFSRAKDPGVQEKEDEKKTEEEEEEGGKYGFIRPIHPFLSLVLLPFYIRHRSSFYTCHRHSSYMHQHRQTSCIRSNPIL